MSSNQELKKTLGPWMLWGLGVGYVISGMYFGWNLGLAEGGPYGLLIATVVVTIMYVAFVMGYAELACAIPKAGGAFDYGTRAMGPGMGYLTGVAQWIEFVFAPPAIAAAIGAYFNLFFPSIPALWIAFAAYAVFTALNIWGVKQSAVFELGITILAVIELLVFAGATAPHFTWAKFSQDAFPHGWAGAFAALPYAIWFYLAIEGIANVAEEANNPQRDLSRGFGSAMATLVVLALLTLFFAVGVDGWKSIVFADPTSTMTSDSPLPLALKHVTGDNHFLYHLLITIGLGGLIASFHGIVLVAGRVTFEFGRMGFAPQFLGRVLPGRRTPAAALLANMIVGFLALLSGRTADIITISVFGALTMYALSMVSLFRLRKKEPRLSRPYKVPLYPFTPGIALLISLVCLASMAYSSPKLGLIYLGMLVFAYVWLYALRNLSPYLNANLRPAQVRGTKG